MYKVRTLPVRFATKKLGEDRSRQSCNIKPQRFLTSSPRRPRHLDSSFLCVCVVFRGQTELYCATDQVAAGAGWQCSCSGNSGHLEKRIENIWFYARTATGTDRQHGFPLDSLLTMFETVGYLFFIFLIPREANVFTRTAACGLVKRLRKVT